MITGVSSDLGRRARAAARARPGRSTTSPESTPDRRRPSSCGPSSSRRTSAARSSRGSCRRPRPIRSSTAGSSGTPSRARPPGPCTTINVIGTLQLLAACERRDPRCAASSSGARPRSMGRRARRRCFYTEDLARRAPLRTRFQRDISELEDYFENFARRHPRLVCCMLRYQPEIGPELERPLVRYLGPAGRPDPARIRSPAAVPARRRRDRGDRRRDPRPGSRSGQRRAQRLDLAEPDPAALRPPGAAYPAPAVRPAARAPRARSSAPVPALRRRQYACFASGAVSTTGVCEPSSATSRASTRSPRSAIWRPSRAGASRPSLHPGLGSLAGRLTGAGS